MEELRRFKLEGILSASGQRKRIKSIGFEKN